MHVTQLDNAGSTCTNPRHVHVHYWKCGRAAGSANMVDGHVQSLTSELGYTGCWPSLLARCWHRPTSSLARPDARLDGLEWSERELSARRHSSPAWTARGRAQKSANRLFGVRLGFWSCKPVRQVIIGFRTLASLWAIDLGSVERPSLVLCAGNPYIKGVGLLLNQHFQALIYRWFVGLTTKSIE